MARDSGMEDSMYGDDPRFDPKFKDNDLGKELKEEEERNVPSDEEIKRGMTQDIVIGSIREERDKQDRKWGRQEHEPAKWLAIAGEEFGEICEAILEQDFPDFDWNDVYNEVIQLGAVCTAWAECLMQDMLDKTEREMERD